MSNCYCHRGQAAIAAFTAEEAPYIVTCGWAYRKDSAIAIAEAVRSYAINHDNIPPDAVIAEPNSRDTVGDAIFTKINLARTISY
jgi:uncharacterized SAM-binding protein YcdF (DUF218 family)